MRGAAGIYPQRPNIRHASQHCAPHSQHQPRPQQLQPLQPIRHLAAHSIAPLTALRRSQHCTADSMVTVPDEVSFSMTWLLDSVPGHSPSKCSCKSSPSTSAHLHPTCSLHCAADGIASGPLLTTLRCSQHWAPHSQAPVTTRDGHRVNHYAGERFLFPGWNFRFDD